MKNLFKMTYKCVIQFQMKLQSLSSRFLPRDQNNGDAVGTGTEDDEGGTNLGRFKFPQSFFGSSFLKEGYFVRYEIRLRGRFSSRNVAG